MNRIFIVEKEISPLEFVNYELMQARGGERIRDISSFMKDEYFNARKGEYFIKETTNRQGVRNSYLKIEEELSDKLQKLENNQAWERMNSLICSVY